jgi:hypothetical protein
MDGRMNLLRPEALGLKGTDAMLQSIASYSSAIVSQKPIPMLLSLLSGDCRACVRAHMGRREYYRPRL